jgi:glycosyltransferase involved in cell wall biosynthesis
MNSVEEFLIDSTMAQLPLVSVIIANYNYARFVRAAIDSIKSQSYPKIECVIIDDCSNDGSFEVISEHLAKLGDPRFRAIRLASNLGQLGAMKAGLENTTGPFVYFLDSDDIAFPNFLQRHIEAHLNSSYSAGQSASDTMQIDSDGQILETTFHFLLKHRTDVPNSSLVKPIILDSIRTVDQRGLSFKTPSNDLLYLDRELTGWHFVATSSFVFRRDTISFVMPRDTNIARLYADYYLARFIHFVTGTITIGSPLSCFRLHRTNAFSKNAVLGGPYPAGFFDPRDKSKLELEITKHIVENIDRMKDVLGMEYCKKLIRTTTKAGGIYPLVRHSPSLRLAFGRGSDLWFRLKYKTLSVVANRFPAGYRALVTLSAVAAATANRLTSARPRGQGPRSTTAVVDRRIRG